MAKSSACTALVICGVLLFAQAAACSPTVLESQAALKTLQPANRKLLLLGELLPGLQSTLTGVICDVDQISAILEQFLGIDPAERAKYSGLPLALADLIDADDKLEEYLEGLLGIKPADSCSKAPKAPTLDDIIKSIYCAVEAVDSKLDSIVESLLPEPLKSIVTELNEGVSKAEAYLVEFALDIKC